jgi:hypothetical protein
VGESAPGLLLTARRSLQKPTNPGTDANPFARPFTSMPLAIDARERRVVGVMVAKRIGSDEPLPMGSDYHALSRLPGGIVITLDIERDALNSPCSVTMESRAGISPAPSRMIGARKTAGP